MKVSLRPEKETKESLILYEGKDQILERKKN